MAGVAAGCIPVDGVAGCIPVTGVGSPTVGPTTSSVRLLHIYVSSHV